MKQIFAAAALMLAAGSAHADYPAGVVADGLPNIPAELKAETQAYLDYRSATFLGWNPATGGALMYTRFGNVPHLHEVAAPGAARKQITFGGEPVVNASFAPKGNGMMVFSQDRQGDEFFQLYRLDPGAARAVLLTDGKSRNGSPTWFKDGSRFLYTSTRRTGQDNDLYVIDPRDPKTDTLVARLQGGGWRPADVSADGKSALVLKYISVNQSEVHLLDIASGKMRQVTPKGMVSYGDARFAPDGTIYVTTDAEGEFRTLARLDPKTGKTTRVSNNDKWDVEDFGIAPDGSFLAYTINEAGSSRLVIHNLVRRIAPVSPELPQGVISNLKISSTGEVGFSFSSAKTPGDVFSVNPQTLEVKRWTASETGGVDTSAYVEPELVSIKSFDGLEVSGFLYRPDPAKFPGKRPMIIHIHGGPEGQIRPEFQGNYNYLVNQMGIAMFFPNVRGSEGYGKTFLTLDNGFKREDSVKDIGAFLDALAKDPQLDKDRFGITGRSYGGYMTLAALTHYSDKVRAGLEVVGISHFVTFLNNTQGYRRDLRRVEYGDERDPKMKAHLEKISPLTNVDKIKVPLMVVTGANDPRVPASEADQIVQAVRRNGGEAWHFLAKDEGHQFKKKDNLDAQFWSSLMFWKKHLLD
ncbi:MAG TPA: S9 family peptidase [Pedomonas sp.]|uniref:S9 family peptidase n=1 Tax=Pedomonas sp. TaxID=2976421 RepID=UPI002F3E3B10